MIGLDTNVLVRYLTQDEPQQCTKVDALFADIAARGDRCFVSPIVLCELVWVLREAYDRTKAEIVTVLDGIIATKQFEIGEKDVIRGAVDAFRHGPGDFADYVIGESSRAADCAETVTFDGSLKGGAGFRML